MKGLTTAATVWFTAAVGLAIGAGFYVVGIIATVSALITLYLLAWIERYLPSEEKGRQDKDTKG